MRALFNTCVHMSVCVFACVSLFQPASSSSFSPPSPLVSFFKCKGGTNTVCVCVWMDAARVTETPQPPQGSLYRGTCPEGLHLTFQPHFFFFLFFSCPYIHPLLGLMCRVTVCLSGEYCRQLFCLKS